MTFQKFYSLPGVALLLMGLSACAPAPQPSTGGASAPVTKEPLLKQAQTLEEALQLVVNHFKDPLQSHESPEVVISVQNYQTQEHDRDAKWIETEFYFAFEKQLPSLQLLVVSEAIAGIPSRTIFVKTTYDIQGTQMILRAQAVGDTISGALLTQAEVKFDLPKRHRKTLVAVLDLEADTLNPGQQTVFSDIFRGEINKYQVFDLLGNADLAKHDLPAFRKKLGCQGDACIMPIGKELGVDRMITTKYIKVDGTVYFLTANLNDLQTGSLVASQTVEHNGDIKTLKTSLEQLAFKLLGESAQKGGIQGMSVPAQTGKIFVSSVPSNADISLDGEPLHRKTDALLEDIPAGKHILTIKERHNFASRSLVVNPDELVRVHLKIERDRHEGRDKGSQGGGPGGGPGGGRNGPGGAGGGGDRGGRGGGGGGGGKR